MFADTIESAVLLHEILGILVSYYKKEVKR